MAGEFILSESRVQYAQESVWGVLPGVPSYQELPVRDFGLHIARPLVRAESSIGGYQQRYVSSPHKVLTGALSTFLWPTIAEAQLDMGIKRTSGAMNSYAFEINDEGAIDEGRRYLGCKANTLRIGSDAEGALVTMEYDLIAQSMAYISKFSAPGDQPTDEPYIFQMGAFTIDGAADANIESFNIEISNNLQVGPQGSSRQIIYLQEGLLVVTANFTLAYNSDDYQDYLIAATEGSFSVVFTHTKAGSPTSTVTLTIASGYITQGPITGGPGEVRKQAITLEGRYNGTNNIIVHTVTSP